ncbi:MAG: BrnA antitoxin family protein [Bryobacteraceae bacterium]
MIVSNGEERFISIGMLDSRAVFIAHAPRAADVMRIISMRKANDVSKKSIKSDLARLDRMNDNEIDYSDIPPLDNSFFTKPTVEWPPAKQKVTVRLDTDVLDWLKAYGKGYQTRISRILRAAMETQPRSRSTPPAKKNTRSRSSLKPA